MTTVVTPTFNSALSISTTLESILGQSRSPEKIIIIDGGSRDNTLEVVGRYLRPQDQIVSEKDRGPYDAMNKGIGLAESEVVAILNSDDYWHPGTLEAVEEAFLTHPEVGIVHGDIDYLIDDLDPLRIKPTRGFNRWLGLGLPSSHPATFVRKCVYRKVGFYDFERFPVCADQDLVYRALAAGVIDLHLDRVLTVMMAGGLSSSMDLSKELDALLDAFPTGRRLAAKGIRWILDRDNSFYDGRVSSGFASVVINRLISPNRNRRRLKNLAARLVSTIRS